MKKARKRFPTVIAISLVLAIMMVAASTFAASAAGSNIVTDTPADESIHEKIDISEITGEIAEPPMLTSAASSIAAEKEWYEYIYYSGSPVGYAYLNSVTRIAFYDPYDYADALVMDVNDSLTDWSSNNTLQISYTTGNSMSDTDAKSTNTTTSTQRANGNDVTTSTSKDSVVTTTVDGKIESYNYSKSGQTVTSSETEHDEWSLSESVTLGTGETPLLPKVESVTTLTKNSGWTWVDSTSHQEDIGSDSHIGNYDNKSYGYTEDNTTTTSTSTGGDSTVTATIADRITNAVGYSSSTSISLTTSNSTTITKSYNASHFNANGSPYQWKIIQYTVRMPMKYQIEYLIDNEWVFGDYSYCLLTTIQGTTRAWIQNNVVYYEHWGTSEAVTWDEFWGQFFTEESLIAAYRNRLYPDN